MKGKLTILIITIITSTIVSFSQESDTLKTDDILKMSFADLIYMQIQSY